jgi:hypothetical protein
MLFLKMIGLRPERPVVDGFRLAITTVSLLFPNLRSPPGLVGGASWGSHTAE